MTSGVPSNKYGERLEEVPSWDGDLAKWRNYKRQVTLWMEVTLTDPGRQGPRLLSRLTGEAWQACEELPLEELKSGGPDFLLRYLETRLEVQEVHLVGRAVEEFFFATRRHPGEHVNKWVVRFKTSYHRLKQLKVELPEPVQAFFLLKRSNLFASERNAVLTLAGGRYEVEPLVRALQTLFVTGATGARDEIVTRLGMNSRPHQVKSFGAPWSSSRSSRSGSTAPSSFYQGNRSAPRGRAFMTTEVTEESWGPEEEAEQGLDAPEDYMHGEPNPEEEPVLEAPSEHSDELEPEIQEIEVYLGYLKSK
jgi:hypothetical protein